MSVERITLQKYSQQHYNLSKYFMSNNYENLALETVDNVVGLIVDFDHYSPKEGIVYGNTTYKMDVFKRKKTYTLTFTPSIPIFFVQLAMNCCYQESVYNEQMNEFTIPSLVTFDNQEPIIMNGINDTDPVPFEEDYKELENYDYNEYKVLLPSRQGLGWDRFEKEAPNRKSVVEKLERERNESLNNINLEKDFTPFHKNEEPPVPISPNKSLKHIAACIATDHKSSLNAPVFHRTCQDDKLPVYSHSGMNTNKKLQMVKDIEMNTHTARLLQNDEIANKFSDDLAPYFLHNDNDSNVIHFTSMIPDSLFPHNYNCGETDLESNMKLCGKCDKSYFNVNDCCPYCVAIPPNTPQPPPSPYRSEDMEIV